MRVSTRLLGKFSQDELEEYMLWRGTTKKSMPIAITRDEIPEEHKPQDVSNYQLLRAEFDAPGAKAKNEEGKEKEKEAAPRVTFGGTTARVFDPQGNPRGSLLVLQRARRTRAARRWRRTLWR
jgi:hypothetical protein